MNKLKRCHTCMRLYDQAETHMTWCSKECQQKATRQLPMTIDTRYCVECSKEYKITENYQMTCLECKEKLRKRIDTIQEKLLNQTCIKCNKDFRRRTANSSQTTCDTCNKSHGRTLEIKRQEQNNIQSMQENRRKGRGLSFEELIRREEWKRVFDEKFANRYIRGKTR